jgi:hypothetical protein
MIIYLIFCLLFLFLILFLRKKKVNYFIIITFSSVIIYSTLLFLNHIEKEELEKKIEKLDLNKDGFFSKDENTEELKILENELISDTGENMFILFGLPICFIFTTGNVLVFYILNKVYHKIININ